MTDKGLTGRKVWWHQAIGWGQDSADREGPSGPQSRHRVRSSHPTSILLCAQAGLCCPALSREVHGHEEIRCGQSGQEGRSYISSLKGKKFSLTLPPGLCTCSISFFFQDLNSESEKTSLESRSLEQVCGKSPWRPGCLQGEPHLPLSQGQSRTFCLPLAPPHRSLLKTPES